MRRVEFGAHPRGPSVIQDRSIGVDRLGRPGRPATSFLARYFHMGTRPRPLKHEGAAHPPIDWLQNPSFRPGSERETKPPTFGSVSFGQNNKDVGVQWIKFWLSFRTTASESCKVI